MMRMEPVCPGCGKLWGSECSGECLEMPSPFADSAMLTKVSEWADEYTQYLEVELTEKACLCKWIYKDGPPKPVEVTSIEAATEGRKEFLPGPTPRLRVRSHEHPECPVHTRRGFVTGFFQWASRPPKDLIALISVASALDVCADEERLESLEDVEGTLEGTLEPDEIERL